MANKITAQVEFQFQSDGTTSTITLDLLRDPYTVGNGPPNMQNWFAGEKRSNDPTGVLFGSASAGTVSGVSLSGDRVTVTFSDPPPVGAQTVVVFLTF